MLALATWACLAARASEPCAEPVTPGRPPLAEGCLVVYVDVGTNIGVQLRKFFQPERYPGARAIQVFADSFKADEGARNRSRACAFGFEANPAHTARLRHLEATYVAAGHRLSIATETAAATSNGTATFFFTGNAWNDLGASTVPNSFVGAGRNTHVLQATVRTVDLARWLRAEVFARSEAALPGAAVVMKLDIEGSEESVLPWLARCNALCGLGPTMIEQHRRFAKDRAAYTHAMRFATSGASLARALDAIGAAPAPGEPCSYTPLRVDDESYRFDDGRTGSRKYGRQPRAPLPEPLPAGADGAPRRAPWPDWARAQQLSAEIAAQRAQNVRMPAPS